MDFAVVDFAVVDWVDFAVVDFVDFAVVDFAETTCCALRWATASPCFQCPRKIPRD